MSDEPKVIGYEEGGVSCESVQGDGVAHLARVTINKLEDSRLEVMFIDVNGLTVHKIVTSKIATPGSVSIEFPKWD